MLFVRSRFNWSSLKLISKTRCFPRGFVTITESDRLTDFANDLLPTEQSWLAPSGYKYIWYPDISSASIVPKGWYTVHREIDSYQEILESAHVYGIGKEDIATRGYLDTGVTIHGYSNIQAENFDAIQFGKALAQQTVPSGLLEYIYSQAQSNEPFDNEYTKENFRASQFEGKSIYTGYQVSPNTLVISVCLIKYDQGSIGSIDVPPMDIFYSADLFCWAREAKLIQVSYECPLENILKDKPILDAIRSHTVLNYYGQKAQFVNGILEVRQ